MTRQILEDEEQPAKIPGWALTYIDLLWLLLLFFILRSAVSEIGEGRRYREITAALKKRFGAETAAIVGDGKEKNAAAGAVAKDRTQYSEILREGLDKTAAARKRSLTSRGVIYFPDGEDKLQSEQKQILQAVAQEIGHASEAIEIRGEEAEKAANAEKTDRPAADPAYARCAAARDYLVKLGIDPRRLRIALGGERLPQGERPRVQLYSVTEFVADKPAKTAAKR
jgi:outer membrane protein OmpA-like peptidoglycan-associated protein